MPYGPGCDGKEVVSLLMWVLETKFRYSTKATYILIFLVVSLAFNG